MNFLAAGAQEAPAAIVAFGFYRMGQGHKIEGEAAYGHNDEKMGNCPFLFVFDIQTTKIRAEKSNRLKPKCTKINVKKTEKCLWFCG